MSTEPEQERLWARTSGADAPEAMRPEHFALCFADDAGAILNEATRRHLYWAAQELLDEIEEDLHSVRTAQRRDPDADVWAELSWTQEYLPPAYAASYDSTFLRKFHWSVLTVVFKLGGDWSQLASLAEELAMNAILRYAMTLRTLREEAGDDVSNVDFDVLWDVAFWDLDFELLFLPAMDGIQHSAFGQRAGMANLDRSEWFIKFDGADVPPHPLTW